MAPSSSFINRLKVQLKLSIARLRMVQQKDTAVAKQQRRSMAGLLEQGKEESARIKVENIIRADMTTELLEILELYCELLLARAGLLEARDCDPGLEEAVASLIYSAPKVDGVKELSNVRSLLAEKYGKDFALRAAENKEGVVPKRITERLEVRPPAKKLVEDYLSTIAEAYDIDWPPGTKARKLAEEEAAARAAEEADEDDDDDDNPSGGQKVKAMEAPLSTDELSRAIPPTDIGIPKSPVSVVPPAPRTDNVRPKVNLPGPPSALTPSKKMRDAAARGSVNAAATAAGVGGGAEKKKDDGPGGKIPDVDELAKRFAQLKR